jgi:hypothetical protein
MGGVILAMPTTLTMPLSPPRMDPSTCEGFGVQGLGMDPSTCVRVRWVRRVRRGTRGKRV